MARLAFVSDAAPDHALDTACNAAPDAGNRGQHEKGRASNTLRWAGNNIRSVAQTGTSLPPGAKRTTVPRERATLTVHRRGAPAHIAKEFTEGASTAVRGCGKRARAE